MGQHGVKKETYVEADAKTARALTFDLLDGLHGKVDNVRECHDEHLKVCEERFRKLEHRKRKDTVIAGSMGFIGGFVAVISQAFRGLFSGGD